MCGIVGIFGKSQDPGKSQHLIREMTEAIRHRGPDDVSFDFNENLNLGHARLSIVDLSDGGRQPFYSDDKTICIIFNGEIYNYYELRQTLESEGYHFKGTCDGEILPYLYQKHGMSFLQHIEGMFAIALHDRSINKLFLVRDRIGEKPLYYTVHKGLLYFSSEMKSFEEIEGFSFKINPDAIISYLLNTQIPAPLTPYNNVEKVVPAHYIEIDLDIAITNHRYWHIDYADKDDSQSYALQLEDRLSKSVSKTMLSDVPISITLSGGIDSSLTLALMRHHSDQPIRSYTLGNAYRDTIDPEFERAQIMADVCKTDHHVTYIQEPDFSVLEQILNHYDEPIGVYDCFHLFQIAQNIADKDKVVMTGNGADEVFGGYNSYIDRVKQAELLEKDYALNSGGMSRKDFLFEEIRNEYFSDLKLLDDNVLLNNPENYSPDAFLQYYRDMASYESFLDARLFNDLLVSVNHSATLSDAAFMPHSVEARAPFLNHKIIEFVAKLPVSEKVNMDAVAPITKNYLKKYAKKHLPAEIFSAPKLACGQNINYEEIIAHSNDAQDLFSLKSSNLATLLCAEKLQTLFERMRDGSGSMLDKMHFRKIFILLLWEKNCLCC